MVKMSEEEGEMKKQIQSQGEETKQQIEKANTEIGEIKKQIQNQGDETKR